MDTLETILVTGYSKAPQGTAMYEKYKYAGVVLEVNKNTHEIVDADFTFVTDLAQRYFKKMLIGYNLKDGIDPLIQRIKANYNAPSQQSVLVALKVAYQRYCSGTEAKPNE